MSPRPPLSRGSPSPRIRNWLPAAVPDTQPVKAEGPTDREDGAYLLVCDPQNPNGPEVRVEPR